MDPANIICMRAKVTKTSTSINAVRWAQCMFLLGCYLACLSPIRFGCLVALLALLTICGQYHTSGAADGVRRDRRQLNGQGNNPAMNSSRGIAKNYDDDDCSLSSTYRLYCEGSSLYYASDCGDTCSSECSAHDLTASSGGTYYCDPADIVGYKRFFCVGSTLYHSVSCGDTCSSECDSFDYTSFTSGAYYCDSSYPTIVYIDTDLNGVPESTWDLSTFTDEHDCYYDPTKYYIDEDLDGTADVHSLELNNEDGCYYDYDCSYSYSHGSYSYSHGYDCYEGCATCDGAGESDCSSCS